MYLRKNRTLGAFFTAVDRAELSTKEHTRKNQSSLAGRHSVAKNGNVMRLHFPTAEAISFHHTVDTGSYEKLVPRVRRNTCECRSTCDNREDNLDARLSR